MTCLVELPRLVETSHLVGMSCLVEYHVLWKCHASSRGIPHLISWKLLFPRKNYALNTQNIACCHAWRNEVIIERYCSYITKIYSCFYIATASYVRTQCYHYKTVVSYQLCQLNYNSHSARLVRRNIVWYSYLRMYIPLKPYFKDINFTV